MLTKWYTHSNQPIIEQLKTMLHIMEVVGLIITYVEDTFHQYHMPLFATIYPMLVSDMEHYAHLI
jgi:hypothetical protein